MKISEYTKTIIGRWFDAHYLPPAKDTPALQPIAASAAHDVCKDGTGIWLSAALLGAGYQVLLADRWLTVLRVTGKPGDHALGTPGWAVLALEDGSALSTGYEAKVYARDEASELAAEIRRVVAQ